MSPNKECNRSHSYLLDVDNHKRCHASDFHDGKAIYLAREKRRRCHSIDKVVQELSDQTFGEWV